MSKAYQVAAYYFPGYHPDPRCERRHGKGWTEWELVRAARPRFPGHRQPRVPAWGYDNEADPAAMERKISAAADHGVDTFIFDWYWYEDGPFLEGALERGYLGASNASRCSFALMWANHDWVDIHPAPLAGPYRVLDRGDVGLDAFRRATDHAIRTCFAHPSYWRLDGGLYFSIYDLGRLLAGLGGPRAAAHALQDFRGRVRRAGLGELHLNAVLWNEIVQPGAPPVERPAQSYAELGFDSVGHYVWLHHQPFPTFPATPYPSYRDAAVQDWDAVRRAHRLPYIPNVTVGWDSTPRTIQGVELQPAEYPYLPVLQGATPAEFRTALARVKDYLARSGGSIFTINAWNEWTEGSYLEPDTVHGYGYLEAIREVFGS